MTSRKALFRNISFFPLLLFSNLLLSAIVVDGKLNEEEWKSAQQINKFYQVFPFTLEEPEQKTTVLVYETEKGMFVGYINYQARASMRAQLHERDADNANADKVGMSVDFDGDSLMAYSFTVSLGGSLWDAVYSNENEGKKDWDGKKGHDGKPASDIEVLKRQLEALKRENEGLRKRLEKRKDR